VDNGLQVTHMRMCEIDRLILHENQLYKFSADPNCALCQQYLGKKAKVDEGLNPKGPSYL
jgi:hypothetical protein